MVRPSSLVFVAGTVLAVLACSSSNDSPPGQSGPDSGTTGADAAQELDAATSSSTSSGGSGADATPDAGVQWVKQTKETIDHEGVTRKFILSVPLDYDANKSYPLFFWLHGNPSTADWAAQYSPVEPVTKNEAIIVYPDSLSGNWDHGIALADNADGTFIVALVDYLAGKYSVDKTRVLLSGWSGGGFMSSAMACRFYSTFKAIGIHAGGAPYDPEGGPNPTCDGAAIATLVTHGGMDTAVGGDSGYYAAEYWAARNGCDGTRSTSTPAPCETYDGCPAATPVKYCYDPNWGHGLFPKATETEWAWFKGLP